MSFLSVTGNPELSIVMPFYNEEGTVRDLFQKLYPVLSRMGVSYEIICIDDGSSDRTYNLLLHERERDLRIKPVRLARNFGKEAALTCGLHLASGRAAVTMDSDLQHPPEVIPDLVSAWRGGAKMVYGIRRDRNTDGIIRRFLSRAFYSVFSHIADIKIPEGAGDFRLLDRAVIDAVNALPERNRFMKGMMTWAGYSYALVPFDVAPRIGGISHWNFFRLVRFAFDGLSSFSTLPLRIWTWCGGIVSVFAMAYGAYLTVRTLMFGIDVPGYASLMVAILLLGGVQLLS
ncbi:MAG: glycosyltransferase family 2 protein, partial [Alphaproteobacteria bacterium]|nr:glycosyltransferase family 2 protein [Alphaproteobacteria bacterium]